MTIPHRNRSLSATRTTLFAALALILAFQSQAFAVGWTALTHPAPGAVEVMLLLSDGTVMASNVGGSAWYLLTPDSTGSYVNGTWTTLAPMHDTRLYFSSAVLRDGRVFVAGGEYGTGSARSEVYDATTNVWTTVAVPTTLLNPSLISPASGGFQEFADSDCKILPNGNVLVAPVSPHNFGQTLIFNASSNSWSSGPTLFRGGNQSEASWVKLPDDSILTIDPFGTNSERYIPATNTWINDANVPVAMYDAVIGELGAALLLADGRAFFLGSSGHTALYTPTGTTAPGTWAQGPDIPAGHATPDAPAAMMVNGKILCAVSDPAFINAQNQIVFPAPTYFYVFDPVANSFTSITGPTGSPDNVPTYETTMLNLPDGTVLYSNFSTHLYDYQPAGSPLTSVKPTITSITTNADGSYHLTGTGINGFCEGAAYGDDLQVDSNYPIIRLTSGANVSYARTFNWSSTSVHTGTRALTTEFRVPAALSGQSLTLYVVANGIASDPFAFGDCNTNGTQDALEIAGHDCNTNNTLDICDIGVFGGGTSINSTSAPIGPLAAITSTVSPAQQQFVSDANVQINIVHSADSSLTLSLSHLNTTITLASGLGGNGDNYANTLFDQQAGSSIILGSPPFNGTFIPVGNLNDFNGLPKPGIWTLSIANSSSADTGTLLSWTLFTRHQFTSDCNSDSVPDICELAAHDCNTDGTLDICDLHAGQPDANSNGTPDACESAVCPTCPGDVNGDHAVDGLDAAGWVRCALGASLPADNCPCATGLTPAQFINRLLTAPNTACP